MDAKVFEVTSVSHALTKSMPPGLIVVASGNVSSSGWSNGRLIPYVYVLPPKDGIWDFDFIATAPKGIALTVISPMSAQTMIHPMPHWCQGVRVHAGSNKMESSTTRIDPKEVKIFGTNQQSETADLANMNAANKAEGGFDYFPWTVKA